MDQHPPLNTPRSKYFKEISTLLTPFNWPIDSYTISGSGPLAIRNIRDAVDIDILVKESLWESLQTQHEVSGSHQNRIVIGKLEIWKDWMNLTDIIDEMIGNSDIIDGFPFMKLSYIVSWKKHLGRPKDLADIILINEYQSQDIPISVGESPFQQANASRFGDRERFLYS